MSTPDPLIGQILAGRYRITGAIGRGGMGTVYAATQEALGRDVAIKMIRTDLGHNAEAVERFKREAQVIARLTNPNIVVIHDFESTPTGDLYIVMEKIDGASLKEIAKQVGGPVSWNDVFGPIVDTAAALKGAHNAGVIHRDLKPENIMVDSKTGLAKVLDFGVAKLNDQGGQGALTGTGMIMGTPGYMAPEVVMGQVLDDPRSDLYSLGLTWLELLIGRPCFNAPTPSAILIQQINDGPPDLDTALPNNSIPAPIKDLLKAMLSRKLEDRPASAEEVVQRLTALRAQIETGILPVVAAAQSSIANAANPSPLSISSLQPLSVPGGTAANTLKDDDITVAPVVGIETSQFEALGSGETVTPAVVQSGMTPSYSEAKPKRSMVPVAAGLALLFLVGGAALAFTVFGDKEEMPLVTASASAPPQTAPAPQAEATKAAALVEKKAEAPGDGDAPPPVEAVKAVAPKPQPKVVPKKAARKTRRKAAPVKVAAAAVALPVVEEKPAGPPRLTSKLIKRGIHQNLGKAKKCRNTNIKRREEGPGLLVDHCPSYKTVSALQSIKLKVAPSGDVLDAHFSSAQAGGADIGECVLETVKGWKFPAFDDEGTGPKEISQRVEFEPCVPINGKCVF